MQPGTPLHGPLSDIIDDAVMIFIFVKPDLMMRTLVHLLPKDGMASTLSSGPFEEQSRQFVIVNCDEDPASRTPSGPCSSTT